MLVRSERVAWQDVAGQFLILDVDQRVLRGLNSSGGRVWKLFDGAHTLAQVAQALAAHYQIAEDRALEDVLTFARRFLECGLLERAPRAPGAPPAAPR